MKIKVFDTFGKEQNSWELDLKALGSDNPTLLAQALRVYASNSHQTTHRVKSRGEVEGSTRKIYRQKGTGRARHGARYAPLFVGGGVAHGPRGDRANNLLLPRALKKKALAVALLSKLKEGVVVGLAKPSLSDGKSSSSVSLLSQVAGHPKNRVTLVTRGKTTKLYNSLKNLQGVSTRRADLITAYDLVRTDSLILTKAGLDGLMSRFLTPTKKVLS